MTTRSCKDPVPNKEDHIVDPTQVTDPTDVKLAQDKDPILCTVKEWIMNKERPKLEQIPHLSEVLKYY